MQYVLFQILGVTGGPLRTALKLVHAAPFNFKRNSVDYHSRPSTASVIICSSILKDFGVYRRRSSRCWTNRSAVIFQIAVNQLPTDNRISRGNSLISSRTFRLSAFESRMKRYFCWCMSCNTPTSFRLGPQILLWCFPVELISVIVILLTWLSRYYSPSILNIIGSNLQESITQQLLSTLCGTSWDHRRSSVSNPVVHALINPIILASVRVLMSLTWLRTRKSETTPRPCQFCSTSLICFLLHASLIKLWNIFSIRKKMENSAGPVRGTFMQIWLWTGGITISFNPLETQFLIITRYAPHIVPMQCLRLYIYNQTLFILWISATQTHPTSRSTCASIIYPSPSFLWLHTFNRFPIDVFRAILIE